MIEAQQIELRFGEHAALAGVDLAIPHRGVTVVSGSSGSGKSSLLHVLSGLRRPTAGAVRVDGRPIEEYSASQLRARRFAFIFQDHFLVMHLTAFENVLGAFTEPTVRDHRRALELLARLGLEDAADRSAWKLSGGERQRVAVARALVRDFDYLFADEPTAALDRASARIVYRMLQEAAILRGVVLVTHDPEALEIADHRIELKDGVLVAAEPVKPPKRANGRKRGKR